MIKEIPAKLKLSSIYRTGSSKAREKFADSINDNIYTNLLKMYEKQDSVTIKELRIKYNKLVPEQKKININPVKQRFLQGCNGALDFIFNKKNCLSGYHIDLVSKDKKLPIECLPVFMHESVHYLDYLLNPKFIRAEENFKKSKKHKAVDYLYENFYYSPNYNPDKEMFLKKIFYKIFLLKRIKKATEKTLEELSNKEKIIFLNYIRYSLLLEEHAWTQTAKYADKLHAMYQKEYINDEAETYLFKDKIKLVEKMMAKIIRKERQNIRKNNAKN